MNGKHYNGKIPKYMSQSKVYISTGGFWFGKINESNYAHILHDSLTTLYRGMYNRQDFL